MPPEKSERTFNYALLDEKRTKSLIYFGARLPGVHTRGFRELSGILRYTCASAFHDIDLGFPSLEAGSKGKALGAQITAVGPSEFVGKGWMDVVTLRIDVPKEKIASVMVRDARGTPGWTGWRISPDVGAPDTVIYVVKDSLPEGAQLTVRLWDDIKLHETPFEFKNVSWVGVPLGS